MKKWFIFLWIVLAAIFPVLPAVSAMQPMPLSLSDMADVLPEWPLSRLESGGKLILSDSPEEIFMEGILYEDTVKGEARLFFHHVNLMTERKRVVAMLFNAGKLAAKVDVSRYGISGPEMDYLRAGRGIQGEYLRAARQHKMVVLPGKGVLLPDGKYSPVLPPNAILTGMIDFRSDNEVKLVVAAIPEQGDPASLIPLYEVLPPLRGKPHLRGSFAHGDRVLMSQRPYNPGEDGPVAITFGDGEVDAFMTGWDVTLGQPVRNEGNYGLVYRVLIPTTGKGRVRCYLNPRGGIYAGWAAVKTKTVHKVVGTPSKATAFGESTMADFELLADFPAGESLWVTLSPPGASNLPIRLMLVPAP